jgi:Protein of unknown function (DUF3011)
MKTGILISLPIALAVLAVVVFAAYSSPGALPAPQGQVINCSSSNMRRVYCPADVRASVQLLRQRSDADCVFNRTWGFVFGKGIWVDRGCRADFQIGGSGWGGWDNGYNIYCASDNGGRSVCPTDTRGGVQMIRQRSGSPCDFGRTWGYNSRGIWVDRGCRADFRIGGGPGGPGGGPGWQPGNGVQIVNCSSDDMRRRVCPINTNGGVRLIRQRSDADCIRPHLGLRPPRHLGGSRMPRRLRSRQDRLLRASPLSNDTEESA